MEQETKEIKDEASQKEAKGKRLDKIVNGALVGISALAFTAYVGWTGYMIGSVKAGRDVGRSSVSIGITESSAQERTSPAIASEKSNVSGDESYISVNLERGNSDGGSTRYTVFRSLNSNYADDEVFINRPNGQSVFYEDNDFYGVHDGLVDTIFIPNGENSIFLLRGHNLNSNENLFAEADKVLKETKERFSQAVWYEVH
jgi:hypothetical protein